MKRNITLVLLPLALFALEKVNLIKDAGFEKGSEVWQTYTGRSDGKLDSAVVNSHDSEKAYNGNFSASCDTRGGEYLGAAYDSAVVIQGFTSPKKVSDIDSLTLNYSLAPFKALQGAWVGVYVDAGKYPHWIAGYVLLPEGQTPVLPPPWVTLQYFSFPDDTSWYSLMLSIREDLLAHSIPANSSVDSLMVLGWGSRVMGQKIYWDDIRLTGYAGYDVGVREILSSDSVWAGVYYKPVARIKSFGRQAADDFLAIAEIRQGETLVWADTIPYTLPADIEDTLEFDSFPIPNALSYTLTVRTVMEPDESDEDDELSKPLYGTAIVENPQSQAVTLEVQSFTANPRVLYSLPEGQQGTISIYDATGRRIENLKIQGSGEVGFLIPSSGVYFVKLESGKASVMRKTVAFR